MLLVLVAWNVREQTLTPTEEIAAQTLSVEEADELRHKIEMQGEEADWFAEQFVRVRQEAEAELAERQARLALAEKETQKVKDELLRLEQLARQLDSEASTTPEEVEHLKRLLAQQEQRKAEAELELAELQKEAAQKAKSYAIVPARRTDGTFRRPIYIECVNNKIILQPEGVELVPADFIAMDQPDNPFDTVYRTIRQYYVDTKQIVRGSEPYPLLIVRPSGVEMYENAYARLAERKWIKDFGYEIVNEDWNIQYPEPNEELRNRILQQLEVARNRLTGYLVAMRMASASPGYGSGYGNGYGGGGLPQQFRMDHKGNVVPVGRGTLSGEELQRQMAAQQQAIQQLQQQQAGGQEFGQDSGQESGHDFSAGVAPQKLATSNGTVSEGTNEAKEKQNDANKMTGTNKQSGEKGTEQMSGGETAEQQQMTSMSMQRSLQNSPPRPQNWGLQGVTQFTRGISRPVRIRCEADRLVLVVQAGLPVERAIPITGSVSTATDQLVQAIWEFQQSWGSAGENTHWRPILRVQVSPGGEQRLQELKAHLRHSGLVIGE